MNCGEVKELFSPYLDGQVSGVEMHALSRHMEECARCAREYAALRRTQQLLAGLGPKKAPEDLALKLRVAISQQVAHARRPRFEGFLVRMENTLNAFMVPATAGLVSAVLTFGLLLGFFALPGQLEASSADVPLMLYTAPQLEQSVFGTSFGSIGDDSVVIEAYVDANGRVQDYRILSQPDDAEAVLPEVKKILIFTTFRPALSMGRPISGRAVISFSKISVKG
ncbi:MAG: zf-HC2 domain-containing protein [Acidobacteriales bacterium]|nr:zf-HC2 domain-containing protein [Candidatus Koribacter versatilis]MBI3646615.1 zf-HC2 domain-containing protein [Terriglobales bacterium]